MIDLHVCGASTGLRIPIMLEACFDASGAAPAA
jgi:hypothetical protein